MMWFWKAFAWIALGWTGVMRRGKGIVIRKTGSPEGDAEADAPQQLSGPGWRRVSTKRYGVPGRRAPQVEPASEATASEEAPDPKGDV